MAAYAYNEKMKKKKNLFEGLSKNTFLLTLTSMFADISTEMLHPIIPIFLTQTLKANAGVVGLVEGIATATQNIIQGFSGWLGDVLEKRKPIAVIGYTVAAISKSLIGFASSWQWVLGSRFLDRLGTGTRSAPRDALIAGSADEKHRGKAFGLEGIGDNFGAFVGPLVAVVLLFFLHANIRSIFFIALVPGLLAVFMILMVKENNMTVQSKSKLNFSLSVFPQSYWKYLGVIAVFGIGNSSNAFLILETKRIGVPLFVTILIYAFFNLVAALISYPAGTLSDRLGRKNLLFGAFVISLIVYAGFAISTNIFFIGCLFILYGLYQGIFRSVGKAFASDFVPQQFRASAVGWYSTTVGLTSLFASIIGGQLWDAVSPSATFWYGAIFAAAGIVTLMILT